MILAVSGDNAEAIAHAGGHDHQDLARLRGRAIVVRRARDGETMSTLDGLERRFVADDLLICDAEGMSVLTAWAAGKFDADRIAKAVKSLGADGKLSHKRLIIPGQVAGLSGELEEALPGWEIMVGPKEAVDIPALTATAEPPLDPPGTRASS